MNLLPVGMALALAMITLVPSAPAAPTTTSKAPEVHGHRGARAVFPENTLPAFQHALEAGVDVLELDLGVTRDGVLVVAHDPELNPLICQAADGKPVAKGILIHSLSLKDLKAYDCGTLKNPRFPKQTPVPGTRIPTLDEVFDLVGKSALPNAKKVRFNVETKIDPEHPGKTVGPEEFARLVIEKLRSRKMLARTILQSFDYRTLIEARKLEPGLRIAALSDRSGEDFAETARRLKADIISPAWKIVQPEMVEALHAAKVQVIPWTANDPEAWDKLLRLKVDGIITDDPAALIAFLKARN